jgi:heme o synthase
MITLKAYLVLCRVFISFFAACSALTGYLLAPSFSVISMILLAAGVFLLASGASALNQVQERDIDALMERTRHRPLPAGVAEPRTVLAVSISLMTSGLILLTMTGTPVAALGAFAVLWYNGLYTPLKRRTAFAAVPGALAGVMPPVMGWIAGNGSWMDPRLFVLALLFFLWQVPHFWLLLLSEHNDRARAGLPVLTRVLPRSRLSGIVALWTAGAATASLSLPLYGLATSPLASGLLALCALWMTVQGLRVLRKDAAPGTAFAVFKNSTVFLALVMVLLSLDALLRRS